MSTLNHAMIDLETLGTRSDSVIISIAAVQFNTLGKTGDAFRINIDIASSMSGGLKVDANTLKWWLEQKPEVLKSNLSEAMPLTEALSLFALWCGANKIQYFWGNSASFDLGLLGNAVRAVGKSPPWKYWDERCYRTVMSLYPQYRKHSAEIPHDPISDCAAQIKNLAGFFAEHPIHENGT